MSVDVFGRQLTSKSVIKSISGGGRGPPGNGFKLTADGQYDIDNKRLCNIADPIENNDAVSLKLMRKKIATTLKHIREEMNNSNQLLFHGLDFTIKDAIKTIDIDLKAVQDLMMRNSEFISILDTRLTTLENEREKSGTSGRTS